MKWPQLHLRTESALVSRLQSPAMPRFFAAYD